MNYSKPEPQAPQVKHIVVTETIGVTDRGEKAEPAWRAGTGNFKANKLGRAE